MSTSMSTTGKDRDWGSELENHGWDVDGIKLEDEGMMKYIYDDLGIQENTKFHNKSRAWLLAYIRKEQTKSKQSFKFWFVFFFC